MGTYRQPGIVIDKTFEILNKYAREGNKAFLTAYQAQRKQDLANKKLNRQIQQKRLTTTKKYYWKSVKDAELGLDEGVKFTQDNREKFKKWGREYTDILQKMETASGNELSDYQERLTQLETLPHKVGQILGASSAIMNGPSGNDGYITAAKNANQWNGLDIDNTDAEWNTMYNDWMNGGPNMSLDEVNGNILMVYDDDDFDPTEHEGGQIGDTGTPPTAEEFFGKRIIKDGAEFVRNAEKGITNYNIKGDMNQFLKPLFNKFIGRTKKDSNGNIVSTAKKDKLYDNAFSFTSPRFPEVFEKVDDNGDTRYYERTYDAGKTWKNPKAENELNSALESINWNPSFENHGLISSLWGQAQADIATGGVYADLRDKLALGPNQTAGDEDDSFWDQPYINNPLGILVDFPAGTAKDAGIKFQHDALKEYFDIYMKENYANIDTQPKENIDEISLNQYNKNLISKTHHKSGSSKGAWESVTIQKGVVHANVASSPGSDMSNYEQNMKFASEVFSKASDGDKINALVEIANSPSMAGKSRTSASKGRYISGDTLLSKIKNSGIPINVQEDLIDDFSLNSETMYKNPGTSLKGKKSYDAASKVLDKYKSISVDISDEGSILKIINILDGIAEDVQNIGKYDPGKGFHKK